MKRNRAQLSQEGTLDTMECTWVRQTLSQWEHWLASKIIHGSKQWQLAVDDAVLTRFGETKSISVQFCGIRCDGTNCTAVAILKAHVLEYNTIAMWPERDSTNHYVWPNISLIPRNCSGSTVRALTHRQLQSVGAPTWVDPVPQPNVQDNNMHRHVRAFILISDEGADQAAAGRLILADTIEDLKLLMLNEFCCQHQLNLFEQKSLRFEPDLFKNLAILVNTWRSHEARLKLYEEFLAHSPERAKVCASALPPRPLKGRWGSVSAAEDR